MAGTAKGGRLAAEQNKKRHGWTFKLRLAAWAASVVVLVVCRWRRGPQTSQPCMAQLAAIRRS